VRAEKRVYAIVKDICRVFTAAHGSGQIIIWTQGTGAPHTARKASPFSKVLRQNLTRQVATTSRQRSQFPPYFPFRLQFFGAFLKIHLLCSHCLNHRKIADSIRPKTSSLIFIHRLPPPSNPRNVRRRRP
jgi:hypothetical protein